MFLTQSPATHSFPARSDRSIIVQANRKVEVQPDGSIRSRRLREGDNDTENAGWPTIWSQKKVRVRALPSNELIVSDDGSIKVILPGGRRLILPKELGPYSVIGESPGYRLLSYDVSNFDYGAETTGHPVTLICRPGSVFLSHPDPHSISLHTSSPAEWLQLLQNDRAGVDAWVRATAGISAITTSEHPGWAPFRKAHFGEVADLMIRRAEEVHRENIQSKTGIDLLETNELAIDKQMVGWSPAAAIPLLKGLTNDILSRNKDSMDGIGLPGATLASAISVRLRLGDSSAVADFRKLEEAENPQDRFFNYDFFQPVRVAPKAPGMTQILTDFYRRWLAAISSRKSEDAAGAAVNADHFKVSQIKDPVFRNLLIAGLHNPTPIGTFAFAKSIDGQIQLQYNLTSGGFAQTTLPFTPDLKVFDGKSVPVTVGDYLAWTLSSHVDPTFGKPYSPAWPSAKRATAREAVVSWLRGSREHWAFYLQ